MNANEDEFPPNASAKLSKLFEDQTDEMNSSTEFSNLLPARKKVEASNTCKISLIHAYVVGCYLLKKSGYEDMGNCGLALLGNDSTPYYTIYVYKKDNSKVCRVTIQPDLELEVESKNYLCFKDADDLYWSLCFKKEEELYDFVEKVLLLKWKVYDSNLIKEGDPLSPRAISRSPILQRCCKGDGKRVSAKRVIRSRLTYSRFTNESLTKKSTPCFIDDFPLPTWMQSTLPKKLKINDEFIMIASDTIADFLPNGPTKLPVFLKLKLLGNCDSSENGTETGLESCAPSMPASRSMSPIRLENKKVEEPIHVTTSDSIVAPSPAKRNVNELNALTDKLDSLTSLISSLESKLLKKTSELEERMLSLEEHVRNLSAANHVSAQAVKESHSKLSEDVLSKLNVLKSEISQQIKDNIEVRLVESVNHIKDLKEASEKLVAVVDRGAEIEKSASELASILPQLPDFDVFDVVASSPTRTPLAHISSPVSDESDENLGNGSV